MSEQVIRVGIAGAGTIADMAHCKCWREAGAEVVAMADIYPGRAAAFAKKWDVPNAYESVTEMLAAHPEIDVVSVAVPPYAHKAVAMEALEAGKHIYLEKPSAASEAEMVEINDAAHRLGKLIMTGSQSVYSSATQAVKRYIDAGNLGEIYFVRSISDRRRGTARGWFRQKEYGIGGVGMDTGSHSLDRMVYLLGTPKPVSVTARTYDKFADYIPERSYKAAGIEEGVEEDVPVADVEDTLIAFVQFDNGVTAYFENTWAVNMDKVNGVWLHGTKAGLSMSEAMVYSETDDKILTDTKMEFPMGWGSHTDAFVSFIDCIKSGAKETQSPGERAIIVCRITDAIYESAANGGKQICFDD